MKQQLLEKLKNTPRDASQVSCSVNFDLNKDESLSDQDIVLSNNNLDGNRFQHKGSSDLRVQNIVYVVNMRGKALMPTTQQKANKMLKQKKAKVIKRLPFTIQLTHPTGENKQKVTLGIDPGYRNVGFSCVTKKKELISGEVKLDNNMKSRLVDRRGYRKGRRSRLWYREPRFLNRVSSKKKGWLPSSIERRYQTHLNLVKLLKSILPISKTILEIANFDIQKIENPNIKGKEYQQGTLYEYRNRISYLLAREKGICQFCNKKYKKGDPWRLHHIWGKEKDRPEDWALLHEKCHNTLHKKYLEYTLQNKKSKFYKHSTFMNTVKNKFQKDLNCNITFGNITFQNRIDQNIEKTHFNDAFVIAGGKEQIRGTTYNITQKRKNNRCLQKNRKGFKPSIRKQRYSLRPMDLVRIEKEKYRVAGVFNYGTWVRLINKFDNIINKSIKKVKLLFHSKTLVWSF